MLEHTKIDPATKYRCPWIEGYCSHSSIAAGETLQIFVSTTPVSRFSIEIYRLGYYGGDGGRLVRELGEFEGISQPEPPTADKRLRQCEWKPSAELTIPDDWVSGVYVGKLTAKDSEIQSYVIFIVRDSRKCDLLFQCSDNTWQAYNRWPSQFSLYDDGKSEWYWGGGVQVSYRRPYGKYCQIFDAPLSTGSGEFFLWEFPFAYWLEQKGYDVSYVSNLDTHRDPRLLDRSKGFLSVGHDEYWTIEMFRNVQSAIGRGVGVGFFSGNAVCGRIEFNKELTAFERVGVYGPPGGTHEFTSMSTLKHERPYANELVGAHSTGPVTGGADSDLRRARSLALRGNRHEKRRRRTGAHRLGVAWRSGADFRTRSGRNGANSVLHRASRMVEPTPERFTMGQKAMLFSTRRLAGGQMDFATAGLRAPECLYFAQGARRSGSADDGKCAKTDACKVEDEIHQCRSR